MYLNHFLTTHMGYRDLILAKSKNIFQTTKILCSMTPDTPTVGKDCLLCVHPRYLSIMWHFPNVISLMTSRGKNWEK